MLGFNTVMSVYRSHTFRSIEMDFARKQLEKYGWVDGEGLGKNRDGISKALKPKLKFDNAGLGHDISDEFDNPWWQRLYNEAANNIVTNEENEKIVIELKGDPIDISTKKRKKSRDKSKNEYKGFVKTSELNGTNEKMCEGAEIDCQETGNIEKQFEYPGVTNDELFKICGGRTVHKGARHGLKMSAKLARIMEQERNLMTAIDNSGDKDDTNLSEFVPKKKRKKDMKKSKHE